jgi:glycosyltransferase involved in cell wall biosynthesis
VTTPSDAHSTLGPPGQGSGQVRVALLSSSWPGNEHVGGVARYGFRLATSLASLVDLTVVTIEGGSPVEGARMHYLPRPKNRIDQYYGTAWRMRAVVAEGDYDIVHGFGEDWLLRRSRAQFVRTFHGSAWQEAMNSTGARRWNHFVLAGLEQVSNRRADRTIGVGPESFDHFKCQYLMPPVTTIHNPPARIPTETPSFIFVGSFDTRKRGRWVQQAVEILRKASDTQANLTVIGPAEDRNNWADWVSHRSGLEDAEVHAAIANSWALIAPSSYEGFGIPTFEALQLGVPAIVTPNPGSQYLADVYGPEAPMAVTEDVDGLVAAMRIRLNRGPHLVDSEAAAAKFGTEMLLNTASAEALVSTIYQTGRAHRP